MSDKFSAAVVALYEHMIHDNDMQSGRMYLNLTKGMPEQDKDAIITAVANRLTQWLGEVKK